MSVMPAWYIVGDSLHTAPLPMSMKRRMLSMRGGPCPAWDAETADRRMNGLGCLQEQQRAEEDRRAVAAARAEAERERLSRERLEQQVTGHHSRVWPFPACSCWFA